MRDSASPCRGRSGSPCDESTFPSSARPAKRAKRPEKPQDNGFVRLGHADAKPVADLIALPVFGGSCGDSLWTRNPDSEPSSVKQCLYAFSGGSQPWEKVTADEDLFDLLFKHHAAVLRELARTGIISCYLKAGANAIGTTLSIGLTQRLSGPLSSREQKFLCRLLEIVEARSSSKVTALDYAVSGSTTAPDFRKLYDEARASTKSNKSGLDHVDPRLVTSLRPYQSRAVFWAVKREQDSAVSLASLSREYTTVLFHSSCHQQFCLNLVTGRLQRLSHSQSSKPYDELFYSDIRGGILADEMGIGKTLRFLV